MHTLKGKSRNIRKHYLVQRNAKSTYLTADLKLRAATHSEPLQTNHQGCSKHGQSHRPHNKTCHAGNHLSRLNSQKGPIFSCPSHQPLLQIKSPSRSNLFFSRLCGLLIQPTTGRFTPVASDRCAQITRPQCNARPPLTGSDSANAYTPNKYGWPETEKKILTSTICIKCNEKFE